MITPWQKLWIQRDVILVGDSASNVMAGHETTLPITLDQMIYRVFGS
jgi:ketopantoate hydroxymethyltransferase